MKVGFKKGNNMKVKYKTCFGDRQIKCNAQHQLFINIMPLCFSRQSTAGSMGSSEYISMRTALGFVLWRFNSQK